MEPAQPTPRFDAQGLIPAVVQDVNTGAVLMVAYMNEESLLKTLDTGQTHFWSRSRQEIWRKGETSGNTQRVVRVHVDCDGDALLVQVEQRGTACHTGEYSCFFTPVRYDGGTVRTFSEVLGRLARVIHRRREEMPENSYTTTLFKGGVDKILKKVGEEAGEVIIAAKNHKRDEIVWEVSDLLYHTLVLLEEEGVSLADIAGELEKRGGKRPGEEKK